MERLGDFDSIVPSLVCIPTKQHGVCGGKYLLKTPERNFRDTKFQNAPRCLGPKELVPLVRVPKPPTIHYQPAS